MSNRYNNLLEKLRYAPMPKEEFLRSICAVAGLYSDADSEYEILKGSGLPLEEEGEMVYFSTTRTPYKEQRFCIVDVETNGSLPAKDQIIEIGAILYQGGKIIDSFESYVFCKEVPEYITKITGITSEELKDAPSMKEVLTKFRLFLGDAVFVAHNALFDYGFLGAMMKRSGMDRLHNRKLCTIDLARKTIPADRYGLSFLNEFLEIHTEVSHRAYADALTALRVFEESLRRVPSEIITTEELISFSSPKGAKNPKKSRISR
ncbi:MAG: 3'-5' exonuclease [Wolinella succinogenes]|uniref:3'-5' exonuclease n=1 Tax=Wolinella succinogenes TaxID=844 RepID=UPI0016A088BB|nr:3'-5' exonuclease [Wolinella succinogenes]NLU34126.1 3'-5' exonuclease [Wolinella succinogenes]